MSGSGKRVQAKDVPEVPILAVLGLRAGEWTMQSEIVAMAPGLGAFPWKVLLRKLGAMKRRGIIHGCDCGCRGDWHTPIDDGKYDRCPCGDPYKRA